MKMKQIKIRSMKDLKMAKELYRYESKMHNQSVAMGIHRFRNDFRSSLEATLQNLTQQVIIFGLKKLAKRN